MKKKVSKLKQSKSKKDKTLKVKDKNKTKVVKQKVAPSVEKTLKKIEPKIIAIKKEKKDHYVDAEHFRQLIIHSYQNNIISDDLAICISKIANKLSYHPRFINYTYKEDMIGDAIEKMLKAVRNKKYDPKLGNAFAYFTRITYNAFFNRINKERKEKDVSLSLQDIAYTDLENSGFDTSGDDYSDDSYYE